MKFPDPLIKATLLKRYKRFLADVRLENGEVVTAHCANPGSMIGNAEPGSEVWLSPSRNPARKLKYSWELIDVDGGLVGIRAETVLEIKEEERGGNAIGETVHEPGTEESQKWLVGRQAGDRAGHLPSLRSDRRTCGWRITLRDGPQQKRNCQGQPRPVL